MGEIAVFDVPLPATLDTRAAHALRETLAAHTDGPATLDAEAVEFLGGAAFQAMLAARKTCLSSSRAFLIRNVSPAFLEQWRALGGPTDVFETTTGEA